MARKAITVRGVYENGAIQFRSTVKLGRKLPLRNRTPLRFVVTLPPLKPNVVTETAGILRVPKRLARLIAESPEFDLFNS